MELGLAHETPWLQSRVAIRPPMGLQHVCTKASLPRTLHRGQLSTQQTAAGLTCVVESKEQWAGDGKGENPDDGNHDGDTALGAVARVVEHGHGHSRVPARTWSGGPSTTCTTRHPTLWGWRVGPPS